MLLVTGASGLLGANFLMTARDRQIDVTAICDRHRIDVPGVRTLAADLTGRAVVHELCAEVRPRWIVHCAALTDVDRCESHPDEAWRVNVQATQWLAQAARHVGAGLVHISTDAVFDGRQGLYSEASVPAPVNAYAKSKRAAEQIVLQELPASLVIRTNMYGWNLQDKKSLAEWVLQRLEADQEVPGFDDVFFNPLLVNELSEIILEMIGRRLSGLYHVGASQVCSKYEFALGLAGVFGLRPELVRPVSVAGAKLSAPRPRDTSLDTARICQALSRPMPNMVSGLARLRALRESGYAAKLKTMRGMTQ